jgi:hypothetical protein
MVLIKAGLDKQAFVGTGVVSAVIIDTVRLLIYGLSFSTQQFVHLSGEIMGAIAVATGSAFLPDRLALAGWNRGAVQRLRGGALTHRPRLAGADSMATSARAPTESVRASLWMT